MNKKKQQIKVGQNKFQLLYIYIHLFKNQPNMKTILYYFFIAFFVFSCSKDEDIKPEPENINVSGKLFAPNNTDPISNAKVTASKNNTVIAEARTNNQGDFTISIPAGEYELLLTKGMFSTQKSIVINEETILEDYKIDTFPKIGVVTGHFDNIENILYDIGLVNPLNGEPLFDIIEGINTNRIAYNTKNKHNVHSSVTENMNNKIMNPMLEPNVDFDFGDLIADQILLDSYDILFLNCGLNEAFEDSDASIFNYVSNGGFLYATDWAFGYLNTITNGGADYIDFYTPVKSGVSLTTNATILNGDLSAWLLLNFGISIDDTVEIDEFLSSWQVVDSYDSNTCISWLNGPVTFRDDTNTIIAENKDLAFTFIVGSGAVFYSSFHTENDDEGFSDVDRIMEYLVFEMSDIE